MGGASGSDKYLKQCLLTFGSSLDHHHHHYGITGRISAGKTTPGQDVIVGSAVSAGGNPTPSGLYLLDAASTFPLLHGYQQQVSELQPHCISERRRW